MTTKKLSADIELFIFVSLAIFVAAFMVWRNHTSQQFHITMPITLQQQQPTIPVPAPETSMIFSQISSDGKKEVLMKETHHSNGIISYDFSTANGDGTNEQAFYSATGSASPSMTIPFNAWSPDNTFLFIQKGSDALVFQASGQAFPDGSSFYDIADFFAKRNTGYSYYQTTGWASDTLLIVNTQQNNGSQGSSYWFEVPSSSLIQLSTLF